MVQLGFSLQSSYDLPMAQIVALLKTAGFSALSPTWTSEADLAEVVIAARAQNMTLQSLHGPYRNITAMWQAKNKEGDLQCQQILACIDASAKAGIPVVVLHVWRGFDYSFREDGLYFDYFDQVVTHAQSRGVMLALENLEGEEYLLALLDRYRHNSNVGYCWDSGHDHCYPPQTDYLQKFADRLVMTHLHDNYGLRSPEGLYAGADDLHFLPWDGTLDWDNALRRLQKAKKQRILNFELKIRSRSNDPQDQPYLALTTEQFFTEAGNRARRFAELYDALLET